MQDNLLKATKPRDRIRDPVRSSDAPAVIRVPETDLEEVVTFFPDAVCEVEGVEDLGSFKSTIFLKPQAMKNLFPQPTPPSQTPFQKRKADHPPQATDIATHQPVCVMSTSLCHNNGDQETKTARERQAITPTKNPPPLLLNNPRANPTSRHPSSCHKSRES